MSRTLVSIALTLVLAGSAASAQHVSVAQLEDVLAKAKLKTDNE